MGNIGAAAAADHVDAVLGHEALEPLREFGGSERVLRVTGDQFGQAGIGLDRNKTRPILAKPFDVLGHFARAGRAIEPDHRHGERLDDGRCGGDIGADQQAAGGFDRDLNQKRRVRVCVLARPLGAIDRRLDLQRILAGLDDDRVDPACDQPVALNGQCVFEFLIADMAERGQAGSGSNRAQHKANAAVMGKFGDRFVRNLGGEAVQREGAICESELAQCDRRAAKTVGLDRVAAGGEVTAVDLPDQIGPALANDLGAILVA